MAQFGKHFVQDLQQDLKIRQCGTIVFNADDLSNVVSVELYDGETPYTPAGTVVGAVICSDGSTVPITNGTIDGNVVSITLTAACFAIQGQIGVGIQVVTGSVKTTVLKAIYNAERFETDDVVDPDERITISVSDLVDDIAEAVASIPADYTDLMAAVAPTFSTDTAYPAGRYVWYDGKLYRFTAAHAAGAWTGTDAALAVLATNLTQMQEALDHKAEEDGYYENLGAGTADQLAATVVVQDKIPYNFRPTAGHIDTGDGNRVTEKIVGGTIAWNQLLQNGNFASTTNWRLYTTSNGSISAADNVMTITYSTASAGGYSFGLTYTAPLTIVTGHKYIITAEVNPDFNTKIEFEIGTGIRNSISVSTNVWTKCAFVSPRPSYNNFNTIIIKPNNSSIVEGSTLKIRNFMLIDLTAMLGSTIADYVYNLDLSNPGAGVAWFERIFPAPYYAYNAGTLMSVKAASKTSVGFNAWDEEWEVGGINSTDGANISQATTIRSKNYIRVIAGATYYNYCSTSGVGSWDFLFYYDANKNYIGNSGGYKANTTITIPDNAHYMRFQCNSAYGTTYNHDICINLSWSGYRDGEYEPYDANTYPLANVELRGIPKLDTSNRLYYDGDTYESDGAVTRKYEIIDLGAQTWYSNSGTNDGQFYTTLSNMANTVAEVNGVVSKYYRVNGIDAYNGIEMTISPRGGLLWLEDKSCDNNPNTLTTKLSGVYLVYELDTPTTETADGYVNPQIVDDFGTERFTDRAYAAGDRDVEIPVGHDSEYMANLRDKLQHLPNLASSNGTYVIQQTGNQMALIPLTTPTELPAAPTTDGTYKLRCTVASGTPTYAWESDT